MTTNEIISIVCVSLYIVFCVGLFIHSYKTAMPYDEDEPNS